MGIINFFGFTPRENINYYPGGDLNNKVVISAVVFRSPMGIRQESLIKNVEIQIPNSSTAGVSTINIGQDLADIVVKGGQGAKRVRITRMLSGDAGVWRLVGTQ